MRIFLRMLAVVSLVGAGYFWGKADGFQFPRASAQETQAKKDPLNDRIKKSYHELNVLQDELIRAGRYQPAIKGLNAFAVTVGGVNAVRDLEEGRGVDPETFAGLYAGQATEPVALKLKRDARGRLMYNNKVVRMYSVERLKELWRRRAEIADLTKVPATGTP